MKENRKQHILKLLDERSSVSVSELSGIFEISEVSVRKLLVAMEKEALLKRTWGGAVSAYGSLREFSNQEKEPKNLKEKISIAQAAYDCINDGDAIFLDSGTTTIQLARLIIAGPKRNITVCTNAINIAYELSKAEDIFVIMVGGELRHKIYSCVGQMTESMLHQLFFDKGFVSGNHITVEHGFTTPNLQEAKIKRMMMDVSKEHYLMLDYTKFGDDSFALIAPPAKINNVITDWRTAGDVIAKFRENGVKIIQGTEPK